MELHYPCGENKGADQLRDYGEADLRLCFRICKNVCCRLKKGKELRKEADVREVEKNIHLIKSPAGMIICRA